MARLFTVLLSLALRYCRHALSAHAPTAAEGRQAINDWPHSCQVILVACNASDVAQRWAFSKYSPAHENSLALSKTDANGRPYCLNVARRGTKKGSDVWVTPCVPEHPDTANRDWEFSAATFDSGTLMGKLHNIRSKFCAFETPPQHSPEAPGHTVLADCAASPSWSMNTSTGLIRSQNDPTKCLAADYGGLVPGPSPPAPTRYFGDVRDRMGCQMPNHTHYPFCDTSKSQDERAADLVARIQDADKPGLLTARANKALPYLGVPGYYYGTNCLHSAITECSGSQCPTSFPAAPNWAATFDVATMTNMAATVGKELRAAFAIGSPDNTYKPTNVGLQCWGPVVALNRDARWGRNGEGGVEDPRLAGAYGAAWSQGLQQGPSTADGQGHQLQAVVTLKHFDAQTVEDSNGWDRHNVSANVSRYMLMDSYLPAFGIAIRAGAKGVMCSYNAVNMTPTCLSPLLRQARVQWGFEKNGGYVTSDTDAVGDAYKTHHFVDSPAAASCQAITKGGDQVNSGSTFNHGLLDGVKQGLCTMADVDAALMVVMKMRLALGLFDPVDGQPMLKYGTGDIGNTEAQALNLLATQRSLVLLKDGTRMANGGAGTGQSTPTGGILPFAVGVPTAVLGPHYNASWVMVQPDSGDVCPSGGLECIPSPVDEIRRANKGAETTGSLGSYLFANNNAAAETLLEAAIAEARIAKQVVLVLGIRSSTYGPFSCSRKDPRPGHGKPICKESTGRAGALRNFTDPLGPYGNVQHNTQTGSMEDGDAYVEAETHDRRRIDLPMPQQRLAIDVVALGKPTTIVLFNGGAVALPSKVLSASNVAIIEAGYPGTRGSEAIALSIFAIAPQATASSEAVYVDRFGRLPYSIYPQSWTLSNRMDQMDLAAPPGRTYKYSQDPAVIQFEFGAGLQLAQLSLTLVHHRHSTSTTMAVNDNFTYSLNITNLPSSRCNTEAVVAMFMSPKTLPTQPKDHPLLRHRQLVSFQRLGTTTGGLAPGESTTATFVVGAYDLSLVDFGGQGDRIVAPGEYELSWETGSAEATVGGVGLSLRGDEVLVEPYPHHANNS